MDGAFRRFTSFDVNYGEHAEATVSMPATYPDVGARAINGIWAVGFGRFGWRDQELRGAILQIDNGKVFGGGANFVYRGTAKFEEGLLKLRLSVDRYREDPNFTSLTQLTGDHFRMDIDADAISEGHFEGHVGYAGGEAVRVSVRRFARC